MNKNKKFSLAAAVALTTSALFSAASWAQFNSERNQDDVKGSEAHYDLKIAEDNVYLDIPGFEITGMVQGTTKDATIDGLSAEAVLENQTYAVVLTAQQSSLGETVATDDGNKQGLGLFSDDDAEQVRAVVSSMQLQDAQGAALTIANDNGEGCSIGNDNSTLLFDKQGTECSFRIAGTALKKVEASAGSVMYEASADVTAIPGKVYSNVLEYTISVVTA